MHEDAVILNMQSHRRRDAGSLGQVWLEKGQIISSFTRRQEEDGEEIAITERI